MRLCKCRHTCGDVPEEEDFNSRCKGLPRAPEPRVKVVFVPRKDVR